MKDKKQNTKEERKADIFAVEGTTAHTIKVNRDKKKSRLDEIMKQMK